MKDSDTASLLIKKAEICYYKKDYYGAYKFVVRAQKICKNLKTSDIKIINHITGPSNLLANCLFKGEEAFKKEDYQRAYEYYKKAIDLRPDLKDISLRLTNLANIRIAEEKYSTVLELFKNGKFKDCLNECGNLISLNPDSKKFLELKIKAEVAINEQNKLLQKEKELKMKEKIELQKINYIYDQAFTHFEQGNLDIAEEQLKKILKLDSANSKALELGSKISEKREIIKKEENLFAEIKNEFQSNNWNALEKLLDKNQIQERFPEIHYYRAHLFIKKGNYEEALKNIEKFILLNKLNIKAFKVKLDILYSLKYYKGIFEEIDKSDKLFKSDLEVMEIKKKAQKELKAIKNRKILAYVYKLAAFIFLIIFLKFLLLSIPGWIKNKRMKKIHSLVKKKEWSAAAKYCSVLLENYGNERSERIKLKSDLARCCMEMGNPSEAVRLCREVLSEDNKNIKVRRTLARSYLKMKTKTDEAVAEYLKLYEFEPANLSLIEVMADYYLSQGIVNKESREIIEKYLKNNRDDTKKIEIYANMLCETMASDNSALLMYEKRLEHEPADVNIREALMTALYKRKLYDRAQEHARILLNYDLKNLNFHKIYSESMINLKRAKEALDFYIDKGINNNKDMFFLIKKLEEEC
jgi:tetratricopeptide (TPR) repeat protein